MTSPMCMQFCVRIIDMKIKKLLPNYYQIVAKFGLLRIETNREKDKNSKKSQTS